MEIVIRISKEDFEIMKHNIAVCNPLCPLSQEDIVTIIANGTPLPKGYTFDDLPSITPQPEMGQWIEVTNGRGGHECSLCHEYAPSYQNGDEWITNYCPNCGHQMKGEEE